jgi:hypothetical protein
VRITTTSGREIVATPEHTVFAGYRLGFTPPPHVTYLMRKAGVGCRVGTTRTHVNSKGQSVAGVQSRTMTERADAAWVVSVHESERHVRAAEAKRAVRYGLPMVPFVARGPAGHSGLMSDQKLIDDIFASADTESGRLRLLHDEGLWPEDPHHLWQGHSGSRRNVVVTLCSDRSGDVVLHTVSIGGRDESTRDALERLGFKISKHVRGIGWRSETYFRDFESAMQAARTIERELGASVRCVARLARGRRGAMSALPFMHASSVRPGMAMFTDDGDYDIVDEVGRFIAPRTVVDLNVEDTHNFVADGLLVHNSVYGFRGADIKNILEFQDEFPDAHVIKLEQNYRSTQTILDSANAIVANNRGRMSKHLWTDLGQGDPVRVRELSDEHAEARFVAAEVQRLVDEGSSRAEIAVFYRTNAQSRVLEDMLVRAQIGYQVIGGTKFYERAEIRDAIGYLTFIVNPQDAGAFTRIANSPRRGLGATSLGRVLGHADATGTTPWEAAEDPDRVPGLGTAARKALGRFMSTMQRLRERVEAEVEVGELLEETLRETGYLEALEAERTIEAQGRIENLEELVRVAREYDAVAGADGEEHGLGEFLQQISLLAETDNLKDDEGLVTLMTLHNAKGLEFPIVFIIGMEDGVFPHSRAMDEGDVEEERRLAYVGVTRAMRELTLTHARRRNAFGADSHGIRSRFIDEIPSELTDQPERAARGMPVGRVASWAGAAAASAEAAEQSARIVGRGRLGRSPQPGGGEGQVFRLGDDVVHAAFGEGVVTATEPGGIVVVRFAGDGSERKLMADYAPIRKR